LTPLRKANYVARISDEALAAYADANGVSLQTARAAFDAENRNSTFYVNDVYQVQLRRFEHMVHLVIRRHDGEAILRDWREFQQIKDELVGPECEGAELYPAQSRLVDESNKYHIFCAADPAYRFPFGFTTRSVWEADRGLPGGGHRQRQRAK